MDAEIRAMFESSLVRFSRDRYTRPRWLEYGREPDGYAEKVWAEMAELGWFAMVQADEGRAAALQDLLPLLRAAGQGLWREPLVSTLGESAGALLAAPASPWRDDLLERLAAGEMRIGYAHREQKTGWQAGPLLTEAVCHGEAFQLSGRKAFVIAAESSSAFIVTAVGSELRQCGHFLVERQAPGLTLRSFTTIDGRRAAELEFNRTPARLLVAGEEALEQCLQRSAVLAAAEAVGVMAAVIHDTARYLQERKQFGRTLASFQVLQHRMVDMHLMQRESSALVDAVAQAFDRRDPGLARRVLVLRAQVSAAARHVTQQAIQLHGGMGMSAELPIGDYYKRALMLDSMTGGADWALDRLAAA